ncbi:hypothetical protein Sjap_026443 [Stephania japonica]|uniref:Uncharacterized protein n=1 Tax=Stephania japonica TaxID=461633 RepID=A0AAP0E710_9MAGN
MATSAFKSTSKRSSFNNSHDDPSSASSSSSSTNRPGGGGGHRRSRSLNRFSDHIHQGRILDLESDEPLQPRGRFVSTVRGSDGFPQVSLEDLANDFFLPGLDKTTGKSAAEIAREKDISARGRPSRRSSSVCPSQGRARSISRQRTRPAAAAAAPAPSSREKPLGAHANTSRRRRSLSVAPCQFSDSESDLDPLNRSSSNANIKGNNWRASARKPTTPNHQRALKRSLSHKEFSKFQDGYSSHSSALTDDENRDVRSHKDGTLRSVCALKKTGDPTEAMVDTGLYKAMQKELRHAVEEMRIELEQVMVHAKPSGLADRDHVHSSELDVLEAVDLIRKKCRTKLEQSEKRKQDLLAEMALEEQRDRELSKIVQEIIPETRISAVPETPSRARTKGIERSRASQRLTEEAEKYFEDFLSNVEDTDISSMDGEKSDASSKFGVRTKLSDHGTRCLDSVPIPKVPTSAPVELDGVMLPWLEWDAADVLVTPTRDLHDMLQGVLSPAYSKSNCLSSSHGSWSPGGESPCVISREDKSSRYSGQFAATEPDEYLYSQSNEEVIFECWRQRVRRDSGGLLLCTRRAFF